MPTAARNKAHPCIDCGRMVGWSLARCIGCADRAGRNVSYEAKELSKSPHGAHRPYVVRHDSNRIRPPRQSR